MKVLTNCVNIENEEFYLIKDKAVSGGVYFGTIPYSEVDGDGKLKRMLNGFDMAISFESPADAIVQRKRNIVISRLINGFMETGLTRQEAIIKMTATEEYKKLYE